ncbi:ImmA/IrrE family metallo-endopeptidase [Pseudalkalibacillus sp. SCS-8]|uniref:ImmA/IrrE family metallo-endopeptidase n=1 Tax=Pseudalkalibacillus nanhaiensis TaxID=3115291 RepID=UPI0032DABE17
MGKQTKVVPEKVRMDLIKEEVSKCLRSNSFNSPPINAKGIIQTVTNTKIQETTEIDDAFVVYNKENDEYGIVINTDHVEGRINWTYAHELGHILLDHVAYLNDSDLTENQRKIIEREAHVFARELLMPEEVLRENLIDPITVQQIGKLTECFNVSWTAIINRLDELGIKSREEILDMIENRNKTEKLTCTAQDVYINVNKQFPNNEMRFKECPQCKNNDFSEHAEYCKKCGYHLYNQCGETECEKINVVDALYCEFCGALTLLGGISEGKFTSI